MHWPQKLDYLGAVQNLGFCLSCYLVTFIIVDVEIMPQELLLDAVISKFKFVWPLGILNPGKKVNVAVVSFTLLSLTYGLFVDQIILVKST